MAQTKTITGTVVDATNEPVIGASVVETGTTNGTITDLDGKFSLNVSQGAKINVSYIGYKTQTITTGVQNSYQIVLKEDTEVLDEVVVTGYGGSQKRATLTTAISKMDNSVLEKQPIVTLHKPYRVLSQVYVSLPSVVNLALNLV